MMVDNIEKIIADEIASVAKAEAQVRSQDKAQLLSVDAQSAKLEHEMSQYVEYAKRRCQEGFRCCVDAAKTDPEIDLAKFEENITQAFSRFDSTAHILEMASQAALGTCWKTLLGLDDTTMKYLYEGAKSLFDAKRFPEAEAAFFFLTTVDVSQYGFWLGLGHAAFRLGNLNQSINAYETADMCLPGSIWPHIYIANCFEAMNDFEEALGALEHAELECATHANDELARAIKERIVYAKRRL